MTHTPFISFVFTCPNSWYLSKRSEKNPSRHSSQDVFYWRQIDDIQLRPFNWSGSFHNTQRAMQQKTCLIPIVPIERLSIPCQQLPWPPLRCVFLRKARGWYHCRTTWGQCSFYRTARWTSTCRHCNLQGSSRYQKVLIHFRKNKTARTIKEKHMGQEFPALQRLSGAFLYCPSGYIISGVQTTSVSNSFGVLSRSYEVGPYQL